jgi:hypothetical protein
MMTGNNVTLDKVQQRLDKLELLKVQTGTVAPKPVISGFARRSGKVHEATEPSSGEEERIIESLARPDRADSQVPSCGNSGTCQAVFIKSNYDDTTSTEEIQKTAPLESPQEAVGITIGLPEVTQPITMGLPEITQPITIGLPEITQPIELPKSSQGIRKFHSWLSYFYPSGKSSGYTSPDETLGSPMEVDEPETLHSVFRLKPHPSKGILKRSPPIGDTSALPPPVQKSAFLRQEEVHRLSRFTSQLRDPEERRRSGFAKRRKLRFDLDRTGYEETWSRFDYERGGVEYIAKSLTPEIAMMIKRELNEVKKEMPVHEESRHFTQFYMVR